MVSVGKRSEFERAPRDFYPTPLEAVQPLVKHLHRGVFFCEPCAGDGRLVAHIEKLVPDAVCVLAMDEDPKADFILKGDSTLLSSEETDYCDYIITNPPYTWKVLSTMLDRWIPLCKTVLLLPADYMHNQRFQKYMRHCELVQSVRRVKWIEESTMSGKENYAWYFFTPEEQLTTIFKGRE